MSTDDPTPYSAENEAATLDRLAGATVLVTGGSGFIGSHVVERLGSLGARPRVLDDFSTGHRRNLDGLGVDVDVVAGSILDPEALGRAMDGVHAVVHLAAMVSVPQSVAEPQRCQEVNVVGTVRVLEAARAAGAARLVFASSSAVYGESPRLPSRESDPIDCVSPYAASKAAGEAFVTAYGRCYELATASLRFFNVFGPRQDPRSPYAAAIAAFADAIREERAPTVFGDGSQTRDFVPVTDVARAILLAAARPEPPRGEVHNVGTGTRRSLLDVIEMLGAAAGRTVTPTFAAPRAGDVPHSGADITSARSHLGFAPLTDPATTMAEVLAETPPAD
jgi:UDP-glucose 4-epimerase